MKKTFCKKKGLLKQIEEVVKRKKRSVFDNAIEQCKQTSNRLSSEENETFVESLKTYIDIYKEFVISHSSAWIKLMFILCLEQCVNQVICGCIMFIPSRGVTAEYRHLFFSQASERAGYLNPRI